jgi:hypothetical protein
VGKPIRLDSKTGKWVEIPFIEAKANGLFLLTLICGSVAVMAILKVARSRSDDNEQDEEVTDFKNR